VENSVQQQTHFAARFHDVRHDFIFREISCILPNLEGVEDFGFVDFVCVIAAQRTEVADVFVEPLGN
jgi:hypothetical protein